MKNNQFKKVITSEIKLQCDTLDFQSVAVDITNNSRMIYVYTLDWACVGIFSCWLNDENVHLKFTTNTVQSFILAPKQEVRSNYSSFEKIIQFIERSFKTMDKEN